MATASNPIKELPYQTYERITGRQWPGGRSETILILRAIFGLNKHPPGSAKANISLQECLEAVNCDFWDDYD